jgi:hypothetical protein
LAQKQQDLKNGQLQQHPRPSKWPFPAELSNRPPVVAQAATLDEHVAQQQQQQIQT